MPSSSKTPTAYRGNAPVSEHDCEQDEAEVVFYQLTKKFVDDSDSIPEASQEVFYYALSVGHHTGVIDCFEEKLRCSKETFERAVACFEEGSDARYKLEGILRSGEIQIDKQHLATLLPAVEEVEEKLDAEQTGHAEERAWIKSFHEMLDLLAQDSAAYVMGRMREK